MYIYCYVRGSLRFFSGLSLQLLLHKYENHFYSISAVHIYDLYDIHTMHIYHKHTE